MPIKDKQNRNKYYREYYKLRTNTDPEYKKRKFEQCKAYRRKKHVWVAEIKRLLGCSLCDELDPNCLDFHHTDPTNKVTEISQMAVSGNSKEKILEEMNKCQVLCANCHRKVERIYKPHKPIIDYV